jgi:Na+/H+ antiporter NhaD/arsenite permease-like protein
MPSARTNSPSTLRQIGEIVTILLIAWATWAVIRSGMFGVGSMCVIIALIALAKTIFFMVENLQSLLVATATDIPYHRFMGLMVVNMVQIMLSFGCDYWCFQMVEPSSLGGINETLRGGELMFECFYFSFLNFTYFGYGDITPQNVCVKLVTMMELLLAFFTVIFLLSDFISLKDALRVRKRHED